MDNFERYNTGLVEKRYKINARELLARLFQANITFEKSPQKELVAVVPGSLWIHRLLSDQLEPVLKQIRQWRLEQEIMGIISDEIRKEIDDCILSNLLRDMCLHESKDT